MEVWMFYQFYSMWNSPGEPHTCEVIMVDKNWLKRYLNYQLRNLEFPRKETAGITYFI